MQDEVAQPDSASRVSVTGVLVTLICLLWYFHRKRSENYRGRNLPPGSLGLPLVGETISLARQKVDFFRERRDKFGNIFKTHLFFRPTVRVIGAGNVKAILKGDKKIVEAVNPKGVREIMGEGSVSQSQGKVHRYRKRDLIQGLTGQHLAGYSPDVAIMIQEALRVWSGQNNVPLCRSVEQITLGVVLSILYGRSISTDDLKSLGEHSEIMVENLFSLPLNLPGTPYHKAMAARHHLEKFAVKFLRNILGKADSTNFSPVLSTILKDANSNDGINVTDELLKKLTDTSVELIVAGRGTVFATVTNLILLLAKHPEVVRKLREELTKHGLDDPVSAPLPSIGPDRLKSLDYLDHVVNEVLRVYPPVGAGYRLAKQTFELNGYTIPKDWAVCFSIRETHESMLIPRREEFDPDRWAEDNPDRPDRQRYAYIPFGAGARSCPGKQFAKMAVKLVMVELCRAYDWSVLDSYNMDLFPTPKPDTEVRVQFTARKP